ncbi:EpsG family protein [Aeromonas enteropelogenes]|uniref:EpsG family protein n=1 Tax=Aeromonas enteropelogenes TaxID=29489 RepID=UPI0009EDCDA3|nr:EpsG family protein [Aeromonas enteropelogenes]
MIDYLIVFLFCILTSLIIPVLKHRFDKTLLFFSVAFVLIIFSGVRYYTGWDFEIYQSLYDLVFYSSNPIVIINLPEYNDFEFGFRLFSLTAVFSSYMPVLLSCALSIGVSFLIMHRAPSKTFGVFIILYIWYEYFSVFNVQRQIIAHAIILLGVYLTLIYNNKLFTLVSVPFAFIFHVSSLASFAFYFLSIVASEKNIRLNSFGGLVLVVLSLVLIAVPFDISKMIFQSAIFILSYLGEIGKHASLKIGYYFDYLELYKTGFSFRYFEYVAVFLIALFKYDSIVLEVDSTYGRKLFDISLNVSAVHIFLYAFLSGLGVIQERIECYFLLMHVILSSYLILILSKELKYYIFILALCISFVFIKYYRLINSEAYVGADSHYERFIPYNSIFTGLK